MTAAGLLKYNIDALLRARKQSRHDLAMWCRRSDPWLSKILSETPTNNQKRGVPLKYLDRIADFFGISTYQLFQPGISAVTERRQAQEDRRSGLERRIGHSGVRPRLPLPQLHPDDAALLNQVAKLETDERRRITHWIDLTILQRGRGTKPIADVGPPVEPAPPIGVTHKSQRRRRS